MQPAQSVILVTGANRGIGHALVESLLDAGATKIYATARDTSTLDDLVATSEGRAIPLELDITDPQQVEAAAEKASDVNVLINNSGVLEAGSVLRASVEGIERDMRTNYFGLLSMFRTFAPVIESNGGGSIASVLSLVSLANMPVIGGYSASKAAAFSLTQAARAELEPRGVKVQNIYPGLIDTDMTVDFVDMDKTAPADVAREIVAGLQAGHDDIFPDPMAKGVEPLWTSDPKAVERNFGEMLAPA